MVFHGLDTGVTTPQGDHFGILKVLPGENLDLLRESRGEEEGLPPLRSKGGDGGQVFGKAHLQHLIGFVENKGSNLRKVDLLAAQKVQQASRSGHSHLGMFLQLADLPSDSRPSVEGDNP